MFHLRGDNNSCKVSGLEDGFCYKFRIRAEILKSNKYETIFKSDIFKGATVPDTPTTISLYRALVRSDEHIVRRYCMQKPHLIDIPGPKETTPLYVATSRGDKSTVNILLSADANVDLGMPICGRTPLHVSMFMGYPEIAKILILKRADRNLCDVLGLNFGHYAIDGGHLSAIKFSLDNGVDKEARDKNGWTMLLRAIVMQSGVSIVKYLLERDCNISAIDNNKLSCIDHAKMTNQTDILEILDKAHKKKLKIAHSTPKIETVDVDADEKIDEPRENVQKSEIVIDLVNGL